MLTIRPATLADEEVVVQFNLRLAQETENKTLDVSVLRTGVRAAMADAGRLRYFLAEENGVVVGQLGITREWSDWRNGWFWWLQSVYVRADARGQGVFRTLFRHVEALARSKADVIGIRLYVDESNSTAQNTYMRLGFTSAGYFLLETSWSTSS